MDFLTRLKEPKPILLDGATGTELTRRGVDTGLPLWSANALLSAKGETVLREIHRDYLQAGAEIITTNTFRTHVRALAPSGNGQRALELTRRAVEIAREAIDETIGWINTDAEDPVTYCRYTEDWPVKIVGGCCGTTPAHIEKLRAVL